MKIAITGASGFIGRHLTAVLARDPCLELVAVTRNPDSLRVPDAGIMVVEMDIAAPPGDAYDRLGRPDLLVHLAWDELSDYRSLAHFERQLPQHYAFLHTLVGAGLRRLVVTGTCFEYGMQNGMLSESMPTNPINPYGLAKDMLRRQLEYLAAARGVELSWARLFYLYGRGQAKNTLFSQLEAAIAHGDTEFNMSGGEQLRDYLPVSAVAERLAYMASCERPAGVINLCSGSPVSIRALVESWLRENDWTIDLNLGHYPYPDFEPMAFWGDASRWEAFQSQR